MVSGSEQPPRHEHAQDNDLVSVISNSVIVVPNLDQVETCLQTGESAGLFDTSSFNYSENSAISHAKVWFGCLERNVKDGPELIFQGHVVLKSRTFPFNPASSIGLAIRRDFNEYNPTNKAQPEVSWQNIGAETAIMVGNHTFEIVAGTGGGNDWNCINIKSGINTSSFDVLRGKEFRYYLPTPKVKDTNLKEYIKAFVTAFQLTLHYADSLRLLEMEPGDLRMFDISSGMTLNRTVELPQNVMDGDIRTLLPLEKPKVIVLGEGSDNIAEYQHLLPSVDINHPNSANKEDAPTFTSKVPSGAERNKPKFTLDDIGGNESVKREIRQIILARNNPEVMKQWGAEFPTGILFYGPPGNGKTMFAHAIAEATKSDFWIVDSSEIYQKFLGESSQTVAQLFRTIEQHKGRLVVLFDEIDSIFSMAPEMGGGATSERNQVAGLFKQFMNDLSVRNSNVLIIGATNVKEEMNDSLIRSGRFDYKILIPSPDETARIEIMSAIFSRLASAHASRIKFASDVNLPNLATATEGLSGSDLNEIIRRLILDKAAIEATTGLYGDITQSEILAKIYWFKRQG